MTPYKKATRLRSPYYWYQFHLMDLPPWRAGLLSWWYWFIY